MKRNQENTIHETDMFAIGRIDRTIMYLFVIIMLLIWSLPIYSLIKNSLKVGGFSNYIFVINNQINGVPFYRYFINSTINAIGSSSLVVFVCACSGYAFSKIKFSGRDTIYSIVLMFMAISGPVLLIPFFFALRSTGLYNSNIGVFLCEAIITIPVGVLMMKNFYDGLPCELMESANIDGANVIQTFTRIYLPLAKPAIINLGVLQIMWSFQDFLFPLMYLTKDHLYTTTVAVNTFKGSYGFTPQELGRYNAALVLISIPTILIFIFAQKYIVNGIVSGSLKE